MLNYSLNELLHILLQNKRAFALLAALIITTGILCFLLGNFLAKITAKSKLQKIISAERADAIKRSKAVLGGLAGEQVAPFLPGFPCNPADARFVGKPVDFVAFPGASTDRPIEEVLLVEVKTGGAKLSEREKQIRDCVQRGRVRFVEYDIQSVQL